MHSETKVNTLKLPTPTTAPNDPKAFPEMPDEAGKSHSSIHPKTKLARIMCE